MDTKNYDFLSDPGHGWLIVPVDDVKAAGVINEITGYSYPIKHGETMMLYLEEDCDAPRFVRAAKVLGWGIRVTEKYTKYFNRNRVGFDPSKY
jgi:hypothetical protein